MLTEIAFTEPTQSQAPQTITPSLITEFGDWLTNTSNATAEAYVATVNKYSMGQLVSWVNSKEFFITLQREMRNDGLKEATVARHIAGLKRFVRFLNEKYDLPIFNLNIIKCKKPTRTNPTYLEKSEIEAIRKVPVRTLTDLRNRTLFEFLLDTGCRISETLGLNWRDIDFERGKVEVLGKGNKRRVVFINDSKVWLQKYLANRNSDAEPLFLTIAKARRLNREHAGIAIKNLALKAGLKKRVHPHLLRHTVGTYLMWNGVDVKTVQEILGHEDIDTLLKYYAAVNQDRMQEAHKSLSSFIGSASKPEEDTEYLL
jgi:integrase/recombinase XerD